MAVLFPHSTRIRASASPVRMHLIRLIRLRLMHTLPDMTWLMFRLRLGRAGVVRVMLIIIIKVRMSVRERGEGGAYSSYKSGMHVCV